MKIRTLSVGEPIAVGKLTFRINSAVADVVSLYTVTCDQRKRWRYIAKTPEEAQAFVYGALLGHKQEMR